MSTTNYHPMVYMLCFIIKILLCGNVVYEQVAIYGLAVKIWKLNGKKSIGRKAKITNLTDL